MISIIINYRFLLHSQRLDFVSLWYFSSLSYSNGSGQDIQMRDITNLDASQGFNRTFQAAMEEVSSEHVPPEDSSSLSQTPAFVLSLPDKVLCYA